ncbi:MAG: hypothetical protein IJU98_05645, partial [Synergistaceae bacterium]|nr:hypothetical protein [Synergistaceae bacterium]
NLQRLLQAACDEPIGYVGLDSIRGGRIDLSGARLFACDAVQNSDLRTLIQTAKETGKRVLWAGSAAIADAIMELECPMAPALGVVTSVSAVTCAQIHKAEEAGVALVRVPVHDILSKRREIAPYVRQTVDLLRAGRDTIFCCGSSYDRGEMELSAQAGRELGLALPEVSEFVQRTMGGAAREILQAVPVSGVFAAGGDTAMGLMESLGAEGSRIVSEIAVGIPLMRLAGGFMDGLKVVTKAGAFGQEDAILFAFRKLKEK